ncbi:MAG: DUF815 domain-containing protein [Oligosphaeraceae bacterium]
MDATERRQLACRLASVCVFRNVLDHEPLKTLAEFLLAPPRDEEDDAIRLGRFAAFVHSLAQDDYSLSRCLRRLVLPDENRLIVLAAQGTGIPDAIRRNADRELALFSDLTRLTPEDLCPPADGLPVPQFDHEPTDFAALYRERLDHPERFGYGVFATASMFSVDGDAIVPVTSADTISLDSFIGYEDERRRVLENTRALVEGRPAANVLLCGDAGTGKSSTVKACANHFASQGVRLIELRKDQLFSLPAIMGRIVGNPLKFIIFIDDLSFNRNDDCFSMLKAVLEGGASAKAGNAVIYATSNRRHIVKESFADREGDDDLHRNDTVQELMSLSDRFGLTVYFERPNKALYLDIIHQLADRFGIRTPRPELDIRAEAFALARGSRSPRAAEQFISSLR